MHWLPYDTAGSEGKNTGKVDVLKLAIRELPSLVPSGLSLTSLQTAGAHWLADAVHHFGIYYAFFGTGRLKAMR